MTAVINLTGQQQDSFAERVQDAHDVANAVDDPDFVWSQTVTDQARRVEAFVVDLSESIEAID